ncbi:MAG: hypothetical protein Q9224_007213, partial [Gallowayella concinna]
VLLLDEDGEVEEDEVVDVELMIGEDVDEEDEVVDVELMIGEDVDEKEEEEEEEEEVEVLEDIGEELEVEGTIGGAEDVGESDEVGEDVKAGDVEEMAGTEVEELGTIYSLEWQWLLVLLIPVETIVGLGVELLVLELVMLSMSVIELLEDVRERSYLVLVKDLVKQEQNSFDDWGKDAYLVELLELDDEELKLAELFTNVSDMQSSSNESF